MKSSTLLPGLLGALLALPLALQAAVKLPAIFGDNMVLQARQPVPVWGWAAPGTVVMVTFAGQSQSTHTAPDGTWRVTLGKLRTSFTPQTLVVSDGDTLTLTNILVGQVWLASGQSNMEKPIGKQPGQIPCFNAEQELAAAEFPNIRIFKVEKILSATPQADFPKSKYRAWQPCSSNALNSISFSAAAYFFGREIHTNLNVPVGLIESSWGGTKIEPWTPPVGFASVPSLAGLAATVIPTNKIPNTTPTVLYNAMIAPLAGFAIRGALWYQGESNLGNTNYDLKMAALIGGWRQIWHEGDFPFYFVQIAPYKYDKNLTSYSVDTDPLPGFWVQQSRAARHIKHTGMVVTTDLVDDLNNIHPRDKQTVGHRLALLALDDTYDREVESESPAFAKMKIKGGTAILKFKHTEGGLASKDGQPLTWFTIAGTDGQFVPAEAKIVGETVEVSTASVPQPVAVRFAWGQLAQPNLVNAAGLPVEPFNTLTPVK